MAKQKENPNFSLSTVPHAALYVALNARCSTKASRQVCAPVIMLPISCITVLLLFLCVSAVLYHYIALCPCPCQRHLK